MLFGSSILPSYVSIGGIEVQLGDIVRRAYEDSGLAVDEWNSLQPIRREILLVQAIFDMRAEAEKEKT